MDPSAMDVCSIEEEIAQDVNHLKLTAGEFANAVACSIELLPAELLHYILQYLDVRFILRVVSRVSSYFKQIAQDQATWKVRLAKRWPGQYPALPVSSPESMCWSLACCRREEETKFWGNTNLSNMRGIVSDSAHYSCVDTVKILDDVVVSGSRDRGMNIWSLDQLLDGEGSSAPSLKCPDSHKGWVWSFCKAGTGNQLVSGSWDNYIKFWQVTPTSLVETRKAINLKVAVLCTSMHEDEVVAGTFDKKVVIMDRREGNRKITYYKSHSKPVLAVKTTERIILSLSEDRTLCIYDRRARKRMGRVTIPGSSFPLCFSLDENSLYVGDKGGSLHLLDPTNDKFDVVEEYRGLHSGKINSVVHGLGSVVTAASDGDIKAFHPSRHLELINTMKNPDCGEATKIDYCVNRQILAAAFSSNMVKIWRN